MLDASLLADTLRSHPLTKHWERDYSLFFLSLTVVAHQIANSERFGEGALTLALITLQNGICSYYRLAKDNEILFTRVYEKMRKDPSIYQEILQQYDRYGRDIETLNQKIDIQTEFSSSFLRSFVETWGQLIGYQLFIHRMVDFLGKSKEEQGIAQTFGALRVKYEKLFGSFEAVFEVLRKKLAIQHKLKDAETFKYLTAEELLTFVEKGTLPNWEERKFPVVMDTVPVLEIYTGDEAYTLSTCIEENQKRATQSLLSQKYISGATAYGQGRVEGAARVIMDYAKLGELEEGEILVVPSTLPRYELFYRKAKAIITDEGGVLSHVAIFCRETKKPGIIGTKVATKVIQDKVRVEVNLDAGQVKIVL